MARILEVKHLKLLRWWRYLQTMNHESSSPNLRVSKTCILCWFNSSIKATEDVLYNIRSTQNSKELSLDACCCLMHFSQIVLSHKLSAKELLVNWNKLVTHDTAHGQIVNLFVFNWCSMTRDWGYVFIVDCWLLNRAASWNGHKLFQRIGWPVKFCNRTNWPRWPHTWYWYSTWFLSTKQDFISEWKRSKPVFADFFSLKSDGWNLKSNWSDITSPLLRRPLPPWQQKIP